MKKSMSRSQSIFELILAVLFNIGISVGFSILTGASLPIVLTVVFALALFLGYVKHTSKSVQKQLLFAGLLKEIWIAKIMEKFYGDDSFLSVAEDMSEFVNNNTINLADAGVDPNVLINNTSYPIATNARTDSALALPLDYYDTENTVVRNAENLQLSYSKMESVIRGHRNVLREKTASKAIYAYAPAADGAYTPVLPTTGATNGLASTAERKKFSIHDIIKAKTACDLMKMPQEGRILVLHPTHLAELLDQDSAAFKAFADIVTGKPVNLYGFMIYTTVLCPVFNSSTAAKKTYGAVAAVTDSPASVFFHRSEVMKADGTVDMFSRLKDPEARGDIIGFSKRFLAMPIRAKFIGAIYSAPIS